MARPRTIDQNAILDAAEIVVAREGVTKLTLDSVAQEAGISKASVIYDYKTKQALVRAVIERRVHQEREKLKANMRMHGDRPDAAILSHIALAAEVPSQHSLAISLSICTALSQDAEIRQAVDHMIEDDLQQVLQRSKRPRSALLAYLAVQGLRSREVLGLPPWAEAERKRILGEIALLLDVDLPEPPEAEAQAASAD